MRVCYSRAEIIRLLLLLWCLLLATGDALGKLVAPRDPRNGVLDAEAVVIVSHVSVDEFQVQEVFLGSANNGDSIELPGFRLFTLQRQGPDIVEPITANTRILLFLQHKKDRSAEWEPTYFSDSFFWVQDPEQLPRLRSAAESAVTLRRRWEEATNIPDPRQRAQALWPVLSWREYGISFYQHTEAALQKIGPVAGDYFAEQFDLMPREYRADLFKNAGAWGSDKLHEALSNYIRTQQRLYETFFSTSELDGQDALVRWNTLPGYIKDVYSDIYYGLAGIASFKRREDLPMIREIAVWAVKYGLEQTCEAAIGAFRTLPDEANLPVISLIQEKFPSGDGREVLHFDIIRSLCAHKFPQAVPLLAPFVQDNFAGHEVEASLSDIVGQDLGPTPEPWLDWYRANYPSHSKQIK